MSVNLLPPFRSLKITLRSLYSYGEAVHIIDTDQAGPPFTAVCGCNLA